jgi:hypothetical protein
MIQATGSKEGTNAAGPSRGILRPMLTLFFYQHIQSTKYLMNQAFFEFISNQHGEKNNV